MADRMRFVGVDEVPDNYAAELRGRLDCASSVLRAVGWAVGRGGLLRVVRSILSEPDTMPGIPNEAIDGHRKAIIKAIEEYNIALERAVGVHCVTCQGEGHKWSQ